MPILATHLIAGALATALLFIKFKDQVEPRWLWLALPLLFVAQDLDHLLYWDPAMLGLIFPLSLGDLFSGIFGPRPPSYLHNWLFPLALFVMGVYPKVKAARLRWILLAAALAGGTHLLLDGVVLW